MKFSERSCCRLAEHCLATSRRPVQQDALDGLLAVVLVDVRVAERQFNGLDHLPLGFRQTADVVPRNIRCRCERETFVFLAEVHSDEKCVGVKHHAVACFWLLRELSIEHYADCSVVLNLARRIVDSPPHDGDFSSVHRFCDVHDLHGLHREA